MPTSAKNDTRRRNRHLVLNEIVSAPTVSRTYIAERTGLTGAAVSRITRELIEAGLVREGRALEVKGQVGRRNIHLELDGSGAYVLGIVLTANIQSLSIGDTCGRILDEHRFENLDLEEPAGVVARMTAELPGMIDRAGIDAKRLVGCGVAVGGVVDPQSGRLIRSDPLGWNDVPLGAMFGQYLDMPVRIEGRAVALLMVEHGAAGGSGMGVSEGGAQNVVLISNGQWIGGAMMLDGRVVKGQANMIGQIGHFAIPGETAACVCGRSGCLDAVASGSSVLRRISCLSLPEGTGMLAAGERLRALVMAPDDQVPEIGQAFRRAGQKMGYAVDALLAMVDPELILLSGATHRHPEYLRGIHDTLSQVRPSSEGWPVRVNRSTSEHAAIRLALNAFVFSPDLDLERLLRVPTKSVSRSTR
ncbi:MAG TPA: ROK family transcriptional regulator [Gammaproteobacteria bacterium]|nr:ROK family transcriptional regulator [Gammaproteobacteria bacterium]